MPVLKMEQDNPQKRPRGRPKKIVTEPVVKKPVGRPKGTKHAGPPTGNRDNRKPVLHPLPPLTILAPVSREAAAIKREADARQILELMRTGSCKSARSACIQVGVDVAAFMTWVECDPLLREHYAKARESMVDSLADEAVKLMDSPVDRLPTGGVDSAAVAFRRLQIDTRKWLLSKLNPKKYGDAVLHRGDAENPLAPTVSVVFVDPTINLGKAKP